MSIRLSTLIGLFASITACAQNNVTLDLVLDQYGQETTWELRNAQNALLYSGGPYTNSSGAGAYPQAPIAFTNLPDGDYEFRMFDSFGDGICCAYGNGSFTLTLDGPGTVLVSGGAFGSSSINPFTLPPPLGVETPLTIDLVPWGQGFLKPVDIAHAGDSRLFIVERDGRIKIMTDSMTVLPTPFLDINGPVNSAGSEQGLLGLAFDPDYANNGRFYVNYTFGSGAGVTRISRFTVSADPNVADLNSEEVIYTATQSATNHNGGDIAFGPDGYLYIGFGDGGGAGDIPNNAQTLSNPLGDMLRIDVSQAPGYTIPPDNPWVGTTDTLPEIWASGLRNPWRWGFDQLTGDLWIGDVGQGAIEEVDLYPAGSPAGPNFGWRCYEGNLTYNTLNCLGSSNYVFPVAEKDHSNDGWCSVIGGRVYRGSQYPRLEGQYIYTDYCAGQFYGLSPDGMNGWNELLLHSAGAGYAVIAEDVNGELYAANTNNGDIRKITDACPMLPPVISVNGADITSTTGNAYFWFINDTIVPGENGQVFSPTQSGTVHAVVDMGGGCLLRSNSIVFVFTGVPMVRTTAGIRLFPNPTKDILNVNLLKGNPVATAQLVDAAGRVAHSQAVANLTVFELSLREVAQGTYTLRLLDRDGRATVAGNVIVQH